MVRVLYLLILIASIIVSSTQTVYSNKESTKDQAAENYSVAKLELLSRDARWEDLLDGARIAAEQDFGNPGILAYRIRGLRMMGETREATTLVSNLIKQFPNNPNLLLEQAWLKALHGNWQGALDDAQRAQEFQSTSTEIFMVKGIAYRELKKWDQVLKTFTTAISQQPENPLNFLNRGRAYIELKKWDKGMVDLKQAAKLDPNCSEIFFCIGRAYTGMSKPSKALAAFNMAVKLQPLSSKTYMARGEVMGQLGKWQEAANDSYTAHVLWSRDLRVYLTACRAAIALGDWAALAAYAENGLSEHSNNSDLLSFSGRAYREKGEFTKAITAYDHALQLAPGNWQILLERATTQFMAGNYNQASQDCTAALRLRPSALAYSMRAFSRLKRGKLDDAYDDCTNAITLQPETVTALLVRANIYLEWKKIPKALADSRQALKLDSSQAWTNITLGKALYASGQHEKALAYFNQGITIVPNDVHSYLFRGKCYAALGNNKMARVDLNKVITLDSTLREEAEKTLTTLN